MHDETRNLLFAPLRGYLEPQLYLRRAEIERCPPGLLLKSLKAAGITFIPGSIAPKDERLLKNAMRLLIDSGFPLDAGFRGDFDALRPESREITPSNFLAPGPKAQSDVIVICHILRPPAPGASGRALAATMNALVEMREVAPEHAEDGAWLRAAENHGAKVICIYGDETSIAAEDFDGGNFIPYARKDNVTILADLDYLERLAAVAQAKPDLALSL
jgi:hypothetical protein